MYNFEQLHAIQYSSTMTYAIEATNYGARNGLKRFTPRKFYNWSIKTV